MGDGGAQMNTLPQEANRLEKAAAANNPEGRNALQDQANLLRAVLASPQNHQYASDQIAQMNAQFDKDAQSSNVPHMHINDDGSIEIPGQAPIVGKDPCVVPSKAPAESGQAPGAGKDPSGIARASAEAGQAPVSGKAPHVAGITSPGESHTKPTGR